MEGLNTYITATIIFVNSINHLKQEKYDKMRYCRKCGWSLEYVPRSFQEQIKELIEGQSRTGYWKCYNCGSITKCKKTNRGDIIDK